MNVKLKKSFTFYSGLVFDERYSINVYDLTVHMTTTSMDPREQNVAYDRICFWIDEVLHDAVLISVDSAKLDSYRNTGQRVIVFPQEPVDQIVCSMLCLKLNAITENKMIVTEIELASAFGDDVVYLHQLGEDVGPMSGEGWWLDPSPNWGNTKKKKSSNKIIPLERMPDWPEIDLTWEPSTDQAQNTVVFADFPKNDNK
jgi:hypothetical protein